MLSYELILAFYRSVCFSSCSQVTTAHLLLSVTQHMELLLMIKVCDRPVQFTNFWILDSFVFSEQKLRFDSFRFFSTIKATPLDSIQFFTATKKADSTLDSFGTKSAEIQLNSNSLLQRFNSIFDSSVKINNSGVKLRLSDSHSENSTQCNHSNNSSMIHSNCVIQPARLCYTPLVHY